MRKRILAITFTALAIYYTSTFIDKSWLTGLVFGETSLVNDKQVTSQQLFDNSISLIKKNYIDPKLNGQDLNRWKQRYKDQIKTDEDANVAINTVLESLDDPYSRYMNKELYSDQNTSITSKIVGIGVTISTMGGKTYIVNVLEGTPAEKAQLKEGDVIVKVNDEDITGLKTAQVASLVRGEVDSVVKLSLVRDKKPLTKKIVRKDIKIKNVKSKMDGDIGYIQILSFIGSTTANEFLTAMVDTSTAKGLIIDLRGNTGGLLPNAVYIANMFLDGGNIVSIVGRNGFKKQIKAEKKDYTVDKPIVLLIDGNSASASEIFSGAMKDYNKAILVGTTTFGKGMVQRIIPMPNETGMNLTIAKYLTPNNTDINKKGIEPDLKVPYHLPKSNEDAQLKVAKNILNDIMEK